MIERKILSEAYSARTECIQSLSNEGTDSYRLFHGIAEGAPGVTIDRYGEAILTQSFREPLTSDDLGCIESFYRERMGENLTFFYNDRVSKKTLPEKDSDTEYVCKEFGLSFAFKAHHNGLDPWLFLDFRAGRRFVREVSKRRSVLNLFSYTSSVGLVAAAHGASEVWNVDFSLSSLEVGQRNAELNQVAPEKFKIIHEDCIPVMRQLAGLEAGGRRGQKLQYKKFQKREFDLVILDPPAWAKSPFGAIDVVRDYSSLFKPALLCTSKGGTLIATNHVASVSYEDWKSQLEKCAMKVDRPIKKITRLLPEADFPSFDGNHPLKIAVCEF